MPLGWDLVLGGRSGREIRVKVRGRPDAVERYTRHLGSEDAVEQLRELTLSALYHGLTNNPLQIELESQPAESMGDNKYRVDVLVKFPLEKVLLLPQEGNHIGHLTLFVVVQDHESQNLSTMSRVELPLRVPNDQILSAMMQKAAYPLKLEMRGGAQRLAIGIRDHLARVSATIEVDVDVPSSLAAITHRSRRPWSTRRARLLSAGRSDLLHPEILAAREKGFGTPAPLRSANSISSAPG